MSIYTLHKQNNNRAIRSCNECGVTLSSTKEDYHCKCKEKKNYEIVLGAKEL